MIFLRRKSGFQHINSSTIIIAPERSGKTCYIGYKLAKALSDMGIAFRRQELISMLRDECDKQRPTQDFRNIAFDFIRGSTIFSISFIDYPGRIAATTTGIFRPMALLEAMKPFDYRNIEEVIRALSKLAWRIYDRHGADAIGRICRMFRLRGEAEREERKIIDKYIVREAKKVDSRLSRFYEKMLAEKMYEHLYISLFMVCTGLQIIHALSSKTSRHVTLVTLFPLSSRTSGVGEQHINDYVEAFRMLTFFSAWMAAETASKVASEKPYLNLVVLGNMLDALISDTETLDYFEKCLVSEGLGGGSSTCRRILGSVLEKIGGDPLGSRYKDTLSNLVKDVCGLTYVADIGKHAVQPQCGPGLYYECTRSELRSTIRVVGGYSFWVDTGAEKLPDRLTYLLVESISRQDMLQYLPPGAPLTTSFTHIIMRW